MHLVVLSDLFERSRFYSFNIHTKYRESYDKPILTKRGLPRCWFTTSGTSICTWLNCPYLTLLNVNNWWQNMFYGKICKIYPKCNEMCTSWNESFILVLKLLILSELRSAPDSIKLCSRQLGDDYTYYMSPNTNVTRICDWPTANLNPCKGFLLYLKF
jgi:hypothetical protein